MFKVRFMVVVEVGLYIYVGLPLMRSLRLTVTAWA